VKPEEQPSYCGSVVIQREPDAYMRDSTTTAYARPLGRFTFVPYFATIADKMFLVAFGANALRSPLCSIDEEFERDRSTLASRKPKLIRDISLRT
jgi:hypothetical protein